MNKPRPLPPQYSGDKFSGLGRRLGGIQGLKLGEMVAGRWVGGEVETQRPTVTEGGGRDL